jgi:uncharacterized protein (TIGR03545 family)
MRKKFISVFLLPLLLVLVLAYFFLDRWVESGLEYAGEDFVGAKVQIDNLAITYSPLGLRFTRLQVADPDDPWKNLFETGRVRFVMDEGQLLRGKYIIDTMEINDIILGTKRTTDGSLPGGRRRKAGSDSSSSFAVLIQRLLEKTSEKSPLFDPALWQGRINIDSLIRGQNFRTLALIDSLRTGTTEASRGWDSALASFETGKKRLLEVETGIKAINPSELKTADKILAAISTVDNARTTVNDLTTTFTQRRDALGGSIQKLSTAVGSIDASVKGDYQQVLSLARLPDIDAMGLAELLLGKQMLTRAKQYSQYVDMARAEAAKYTASQPTMESPPRMKGQNIHFPVERGYPKYWVKNVKISGGTDRTQDPDFIYLRGVVKNVTSDQRVTGVPMTASFEGTKGTSMTMQVSALIDRRKEVPLDEYRAQATGIPLAAFELGKSDFLPSKISHALLNTDVAVTIPGNRFDATASLGFHQLNLEFAVEPRNLGERLARTVLQGVSAFDAGLRLWNKEEGADVAFTTDLDDQFARGIKGALGAELTRIQNEIKEKVDAKLSEKRKEFEAFYAQKRDQVQKQIDVYQNLIKEKTDLLDSKKKELEARLEKEKKGALDNLMKGIFKK